MMARRATGGVLVFAGLLIAAGNLRAALTSVGPVLEQLRADVGISSFSASFLISLPLVMFAVLSPVVPRLATRFGLELTMLASLGVLAAGILLRSLPGLPLMWIGTVGIGAAIATLNVLLPAVVKRDFPTRIGPVTGAYSAVQAAVAAIAAGVAVPLSVLTPFGWRLSLGIWAGFALIAVGFWLPQVKRGQPAPVEMVTTGGIVLPAATGAVPPPLETPPWRSPIAWQLTLFMGLQSVAYYSVITWLPAIEWESGVSAADAGFHLFLMNAAGIIGTLAASALIPRFRDQRALGVVAGLLHTLVFVGLLFAPAWGALWAICSGVAGGMAIVLALSFFGLRTQHFTHAAQVSGMAQSFGYVLAAMGPPIVGLLFDAVGSWGPSLVLLICVGLCLTVIALFAGRDRVMR